MVEFLSVLLTVPRQICMGLSALEEHALSLSSIAVPFGWFFQLALDSGQPVTMMIVVIQPFHPVKDH